MKAVPLITVLFLYISFMSLKIYYLYFVTNNFVGEDEDVRWQTRSANLFSNNVLRTRHVLYMVLVCPLLATEYINHSNKGRAVNKYVRKLHRMEREEPKSGFLRSLQANDRSAKIMMKHESD